MLFCDKVLFSLMLSLVGISLVLSYIYPYTKIVSGKKSRICWKYAKKQLFFVPPVLLFFIARWILNLSFAKTSLSCLIVMIMLGFLTACFQFFFVGLGTSLLVWHVWLSGTAGLILDFDQFSRIKEMAFQFQNSTWENPQIRMLVLNYITSQVQFWIDRVILPLFLAGTAFLGLGIGILWKTEHYTVRQRRIAAIPAAIGWLTFSCFIYFWLFKPLYTILMDLQRMVFP